VVGATPWTTCCTSLRPPTTTASGGGRWRDSSTVRAEWHGSKSLSSLEQGFRFRV
jgi:hypothetical protein